jgi:transposase
LTTAESTFQTFHKSFFDENSLRRVPQPLYSSDIAPSNFWLFGHMKTALEGSHFKEPEDLLEAITESFKEIYPSELMIVFQHWVERVR